MKSKMQRADNLSSSGKRVSRPSMMDWTYFTAPSRTHRSSFWLRVRPGTLLYVKLVVFAADEVRGQVLGREAGLHRCEDLPGVVVVDVRLLEGLRHEVELSAHESIKLKLILIRARSTKTLTKTRGGSATTGGVCDNTLVLHAAPSHNVALRAHVSCTKHQTLAMGAGSKITWCIRPKL